MTTTQQQQPLVLVVDDRPNMLYVLKKALRYDARVLTAGGGAAAVGVLRDSPVDVVLCDLKMPDTSGLDVLASCRRLRPEARFVLMTAYATVDTAVRAMRLGAYDYITKPFDPAEARAIVVRALGRTAAAREPEDESGLPGITGKSPAFVDLAGFVRRVARSDAAVLLVGETGTGKERIARALHQMSSRRDQRCVAVNCAAIPHDMLELELFGYSRGAFSDATQDKAGLFEEAHGGTLLLDEVDETPLSLQAKLARVLETGTLRRAGDSQERQVDVRVVALTHRDLQGMLRDGSFRPDLWYRLNVALVQVPPLRERRADIDDLASRFLMEFSRSDECKVTGFTAAALEALRRFDWPGNVRQLRAVVERACAVSLDERIDIGELPPDIRGQDFPSPAELADLPWGAAMARARSDSARAYLQEVLMRHRGRVSEAAAHAELERESFYRLLRKYAVQPELYRQPPTDEP